MEMLRNGEIILLYIKFHSILRKSFDISIIILSYYCILYTYLKKDNIDVSMAKQTRVGDMALTVLRMRKIKGE